MKKVLMYIVCGINTVFKKSYIPLGELAETLYKQLQFVFTQCAAIVKYKMEGGGKIQVDINNNNYNYKYSTFKNKVYNLL